MVDDHTHDGSANQGGKLDWDDIFNDAEHDHSCRLVLKNVDKVGLFITWGNI